jgi:hypothetical protein
MSISHRSPILRLGHWLGRKLLCWRTVRVLVVLSALVALFYAGEDWRGKRDWEKFVREGEAKGEHFTREAFIPPSIPDDQNFAMIPAFAPLFEYTWPSPNMADRLFWKTPPQWRDEEAHQRIADLSVYRSTSYGGDQEGPLLKADWKAGVKTDLMAWQTYYRNSANFPVAKMPQDPASDVLLALGKFDNMLDQIRAGAKDRPKSRFPVHYDDGPAMLYPHLSMLRTLSKILALRTTADLQSGNSDEALADVKLCLRLGDSIKTEPMLLSQLVRIAILQFALQPIWEGLATHQWNDRELESVQQELTPIDFLSDYGRTVGYECADRISLISGLRRRDLHAPEFIDMFTIITGGDLTREGARKQMAPIAKALQLYLDFCPSGWLYQDQLEIGKFCENNALPLVDAKSQRVYSEKSEVLLKQRTRSKETPRYALVIIPERSATGSEYRFAQGQTARNEGIVACALERYRIHYGQYPDSTGALSPEFIRDLPHDVIDGKPLRYRRTADGRFVLYSIGWDEIDDGGTVDKQTHTWGRTGDWAWSYPPVEPKGN